MQQAAPAPDPGLLRALRDALAALAGEPPVRVEAEWSQAGTQHSGRAFRFEPDGPRRVLLPDAAVATFAALRTQMATPTTGAWFSARAVLDGGEVVLMPNYDRRPDWDAPGLSMLETPAAGPDGAPPAPPVPSEERWLADLRRHPRDRAHLPDWLAPDAVEGEAVAELRAALDGLGVPRAAVVLPGEPAGPAFEGALEVVRYSPAHLALRITDYGQHHLLGEFRSERDACFAVWQYLTAPLPAPVRLTSHEVAARAAQAQESYQHLADRLRNVGQGGLITNLATGVPYDRLGGLDGLYFFAWDTPWEMRSLPPTANAPGARVVTFVALRPVEVQAEIVAPWFGQPGGGIRFHVEGGRAVRDLVRDQVLAVVDVVP